LGRVPGVEFRAIFRNRLQEKRCVRAGKIFSSASLSWGSSLYAWRFISLDTHPYEDAAFLMRHAHHLAEGQGIVWNAGEPPVDGVTDFLLVLLVAAVKRVAGNTGIAVRALCIAAHVLTRQVFHVHLRHRQRSSRLVCRTRG
jgi:hypothetical protein